MKLASMPSKNPRNRNGSPVIVSSDNQWGVPVPSPCGETLLEVLQNWNEVGPSVHELSRQLNGGKVRDVFPFRMDACLAPLPNAPGFYDGSAFLSHVKRARKARGDEMPASARVTPLMYQGVSDHCLSSMSPLEIQDEKFGGDFEGEFAVVCGEIPKGTPADKMQPHILFFCLFNDITLREIVKVEIETKFGFLQSKPNSAFAPLLVSPDELGDSWDGKRIHLDLRVDLNGKRFGTPNGSEMHFSFGELMAHACRTRPLSAGSIIGCGTVSNEDKDTGFACLTEKRFQEVIDYGEVRTGWLKPGDRVFMDVVKNGVSVFGPIDQSVRL